MASDTARRMADAAGLLLGTLNPTQRAACQWPFPSDEERQRWYYTPTDHGGVTLSELSARQQQHAMTLVRTGTSRAGYVTVATIIGLENVLDELEGFNVSWGHARGRDPGRYYLRIFGNPGADQWSWRFGGHHVSINHLVRNGVVASTTPFFLGADPASAPLLGPHPLRPLAGVEDLARDLVRSLDETQLGQATLSAVAPSDIVTANRPRLVAGDAPLALDEVWRGAPDPAASTTLRAAQIASDAALGRTTESHHAVSVPAAPRGVAAAVLNDTQRDQLRAVLHQYLDRVPDELAAREQAKFAGDRIGAVYLAWAGSVQPGRPHYYRLHGPRLWCEYDNTQRDANHIHTVWRDPVGDFGFDVLAEHRRAMPHD
jgi:hypothetical protein